MPTGLRNFEVAEAETVGIKADMSQLAAGALDATGVSVEPVSIRPAQLKGYERPDLIEKNRRLVEQINKRYNLPRFLRQPEQDDSIRENGACIDMDPDLFSSRSHKKTEIAKAACNERCEVRTACLEFALKTYVSGIWGGTNGRERDRIRQQRRLEAKAIKADGLDVGS